MWAKFSTRYLEQSSFYTTVE